MNQPNQVLKEQNSRVLDAHEYYMSSIALDNTPAKAKRHIMNIVSSLWHKNDGSLDDEFHYLDQWYKFWDAVEHKEVFDKEVSTSAQQ